MKVHILILMFLAQSGCATNTLNLKQRVAIASGVGAAAGGIGGAVFSPNAESRGTNALVFGLAGALVGGTIRLMLEPEAGRNSVEGTLKSRDQETQSSLREFVIQPDPNLPAFLKGRLKPALIEEYLERDSLADDGSLREPHRVYRIKRPTELTPLNGRAEMEVKNDL